MGADLTAWIEYDVHQDPPFSDSAGVECLPLGQWGDLYSNKDYPFYGAVSGCRNETCIPPLFPQRGRPENASHPVSTYFDTEDPHNAGWLSSDEVDRAIQHHDLTPDQLSLEVQIVMHILSFLSLKIGPDRVRFVFVIGSA